MFLHIKVLLNDYITEIVYMIIFINTVIAMYRYS